MAKKLEVVKNDSPQRFVFWFGIYSPVYIMTYGYSLDDCLDEAVDYIADHYPGLLADNEVNAEYERCKALGMTDDQACNAAEVDTTTAGNCGNYLNSDEWGIMLDNPDRATIKEWLKTG